MGWSGVVLGPPRYSYSRSYLSGKSVYGESGPDKAKPRNKKPATSQAIKNELKKRDRKYEWGASGIGDTLSWILQY